LSTTGTGGVPEEVKDNEFRLRKSNVRSQLERFRNAA
jgi:hypothetical protein